MVQTRNVPKHGTVTGLSNIGQTRNEFTGFFMGEYDAKRLANLERWRLAKVFICAQCRGEFHPKAPRSYGPRGYLRVGYGPDPTYCSNACRQKTYRQRRKGE